MTIVFLSNYFNHHQRALSDSLNRLSDGYYFISTKEMREERKQLGYGTDFIPDYVVPYNEKTKDKVLSITNNADIVIIGGAPEYLINDRMKSGKIVFRYSERWYRNEFEWWKWPIRVIRHHFMFGRYKNVHLLCAGAYVAADCSKTFLFRSRMYKWGYFPETKHYDTDRLLSKKNRNEILWCGRFLDWKHPDDAILIAQRLKQNGYTFILNIIGTGIMEEALRQMICDHHLEDCVHLLGAMPPERVREHMEQAGIYLFTSDRQEGWGAVLNESMNSGCAVVASQAIGAVPYLIKNDENGLIYKSGDIDGLYCNVKYLLDHPEEQQRLGEAAYRTIIDGWNAETAAECFVDLAQHILDGEEHPDLYRSGPCSKAEIIKENWFDAEEI